MLTQALPYNFIYDDINKVQRYSNKFESVEGNGIPNKEEWKALIPFLEQVSAHSYVKVLVWNVFTNRIVYAVDKKNVAGYNASLYLAKNGINFSMSNMHPHFITAILTMQKKALEYVFSNKPGFDKIVTHFDALYKKNNGEYMHFLQQTVCIETDDNGYPLLLLSYIHDITYLKKESTANLIVIAPDEVKWWNFNFDANTLEPVKPLSRQEKKILAYLANGRSSKEIARELFISPFTIDTHRKNLLNKTNCVDTTGMITYAKLVGLL
jgi:DNA-binding CsgD family transcriptional regulator